MALSPQLIQQLLAAGYAGPAGPRPTPEMLEGPQMPDLPQPMPWGEYAKGLVLNPIPGTPSLVEGFPDNPMYTGMKALAQKMRPQEQGEPQQFHAAGGELQAPQAPAGLDASLDLRPPSFGPIDTAGYEGAVQEGRASMDSAMDESLGYESQLAGLTDKLLATQQGFRQKFEDINAEAKREIDAANVSLDEARKLSRYHRLSLEEIQQYEATLKDPDASPKQQLAAKKSLAKAEEINPGRFWDSRPAWAKVMGVLAIAFGENLRSKIGGPNVALQIINDAIDKDISAQMHKAKKRGYAVRDAQNYVELLRAQFRDEKSQMLAARQLMGEEIQTKINGVLQMSQMGGQRAQLDLLAQQWNMQLQKDKIQFEMHRRDMALRSATLRLQMGAAGRETQAAFEQRMGDSKDMLGAVDALSKQFEKVGLEAYTPGVGEGEGWLHGIAKAIHQKVGSEAEKYEELRKQIYRRYGRTIEQRLTKEDAEFYRSNFASARAPKDFGLWSLKRLRDGLEHKARMDMEAARLGGRNVSQYEGWLGQ